MWLGWGLYHAVGMNQNNTEIILVTAGIQWMYHTGNLEHRHQLFQSFLSNRKTVNAGKQVCSVEEEGWKGVHILLNCNQINFSCDLWSFRVGQPAIIRSEVWADKHSLCPEISLIITCCSENRNIQIYSWIRLIWISICVIKGTLKGNKQMKLK